MATESTEYNPSKIEPKWQAYWEQNQTFKTEDFKTSKKPKYYVLDMFPYPSSSGLHVGHPEGYTATDILARYKRTRGFNVLHPMGWDAFGLPAEQYALATGVHPAITTGKAIENFKRQLSMLGFSYDWSREVTTCEPDYYRWTQYLFIKLYEKGLAYQKEVPVNWCPELKTVLANEEVVDGKSERGGHPVFRVPMKQWMLKITDYAERLLEGLDKIDWPEGTKELQRNWIGKSKGLKIQFGIVEEGAPKLEATHKLEIFTTRPDTIFGVTFMVVAPEHPLVGTITTKEQKAEVEEYVLDASKKSEIARQDQSKKKTGVFTGAYAINPVNHEHIPIYISDYVMMGYGTGAIMAVPGHDERDKEFAEAYCIPVRTVINEQGICINSGFINDLPSQDAIAKIIAWAEKEKKGQGTTQYKLRDWLFSRQRYWGEPIPVLHSSDGKKIPVAMDELPITLPEVESYEPSGTGASPLSVIEDWVNVKKDGQDLKRETDTMPGSAGSSWYFLRYIDPRNSSAPWGKEAEKHWMPVDLYLGGDEHAVGHLLYSRFWMKVFFDLGMVSHDEPFQKLVHQGMILGQDGEKMSKSRGNVVNPDSVVQKYGADTLRLYEMFMGPLEKDKPWSSEAIEGVFRFLNRAWRMQNFLAADYVPTPDDQKALHKTIRKVTEDIEALRFNTAISQMMIFVNHHTKIEKIDKQTLCTFVQLLNPFAPHMAEELWEKLGQESSLSYADWPMYDASLAKDDLIEFPIQVMGKTKITVGVELGATQDVVEKLARENPTISKMLAGKQVKKIIFVPNKILNFIVA